MNINDPNEVQPFLNNASDQLLRSSRFESSHRFIPEDTHHRLSVVPERRT